MIYASTLYTPTYGCTLHITSILLISTSQALLLRTQQNQKTTFKPTSYVTLYIQLSKSGLHIPPENKYENEGGPGIFQCFSLLEDRIKFGSMACKNKLLLLRSIIFNFLIGNGDAHGKNFSLLYDLEEESLAPLYDLLCTIIYSRKNSAKMAMKINGKYQFRLITMNDWECLAILLGMRPDFVKRHILDLSHSIINTAPKLAMELNADPQTKSPIYTKILSVISESSYHYLN